MKLILACLSIVVILFSCNKDFSNTNLKKELIVDSLFKSDQNILSRCPSGLKDPPIFIGPISGYNAIYWQYNSGNSSYVFNNGLTNDILLTSPNGVYSLVFQYDGNLVLYRYFQSSSQVALWSSATYNKPARCLAFQSDGNIVLYNLSRTIAYWATGTTNGQQVTNLNALLAVQNDGNLVNYRLIGYPDNYYSFWTSDTQGGSVSCHH